MAGRETVKTVSDKTRILVAEEDPIQRLLLQEYLEIGNRFDVLEVTGVYQLLSFCESPLSHIGLVLLDMEWTKVDGIEMILEIRKRNPSLPILGMTDRRADFYSDTRLRNVVVGLIPKPFAPQHLHRSIQAVLRTKDQKKRVPVTRISPAQSEKIHPEFFLSPKGGIHG